MPDYEDEDDADDAFLDEVLELAHNPQLDDALILRLTYDLATRLHNPAEIAHRYGLDGVEKLREYLRGHPWVVNEARKLRALFESDAAAEDRVRMKFLHATENLIIPMTGLVADPTTPLGARIDGFKQIQRGAGLDGLSATQRQQLTQKAEGHPFQLVIQFTKAPPVNITATDVYSSADEPTLELPTVTEEDDTVAEDDV